MRWSVYPGSMDRGAERACLGTAVLLALLLASGCKADDPLPASAVVQQAVYNSGPLNYLLFLPPASTAAESGKFPLIISLHGIGERGTDLGILKRDGLPRELDGRDTFPFIVVSPQCPSSTEWYYDRTDTLVSRLLDIVVRRYPVDTNRIYVTGYSMGGIGAWDLAVRYPGRFAAIVPIASRREPWWDLAPMKDVPVWAFHGALDDVVPLSMGQDVVDAFRAVGGQVTFTIYPDLSHNAWTRTYLREDVFNWMLSKRRH